jgi:phage protein U
MADSVLLALGQEPDLFVFSVQGIAYDQLQRSSAWRWAKMPRLGRLPGRQSLGPEDDTIELSGSIITERSGYGNLTALRALMAKGEPQMLCDSLGNVHGRWCLESVQETQNAIHIDGLPRKQTFSLKLSVYGEDAAAIVNTPDQAAVDRWERNRPTVEATA